MTIDRRAWHLRAKRGEKCFQLDATTETDCPMGHDIDPSIFRCTQTVSLEVAPFWHLSYSYSMMRYSYSMRFLRVRDRVLLARSTSTKNLRKSRIETTRHMDSRIRVRSICIALSEKESSIVEPVNRGCIRMVAARGHERVELHGN